MKQPTPHPSKIEDELESPNDTWGRNNKVRINHIPQRNFEFIQIKDIIIDSPALKDLKLFMILSGF